MHNPLIQCITKHNSIVKTHTESDTDHSVTQKKSITTKAKKTSAFIYHNLQILVCPPPPLGPLTLKGSHPSSAQAWLCHAGHLSTKPENVICPMLYCQEKRSSDLSLVLLDLSPNSHSNLWRADQLSQTPSVLQWVALQTWNLLVSWCFVPETNWGYDTDNWQLLFPQSTKQASHSPVQNKHPFTFLLPIQHKAGS